MRFPSLEQWLAWQETLHPQEIDLGLERVAAVWARMAAGPLAARVVTVAGTNGKGTSVALLAAMLRAAGLRVGAYTSPHLLRYNERINIDGQPVSDDQLCHAFARVDAARGDISLSYFEFGTLAAFELFARAGLDVALLEVGMGGSLDAVNIVDADVALVTALDVDHVRWLGHDRESIAREKAGILRGGRPAVVSDPRPPRALLDHARRLGTPLWRLGEDYHYEALDHDRWSWRCGARCWEDLPRPVLRGAWQLQNAAGALMVMMRLADFFPLERAAVEAGLRTARLPGRFQCFPGTVSCIVDVGHNRQAAAALAAELQRRPVAGRTHAVWAMLDDKDAEAVCRALAPVVDHWHLGGLDVARGASAAALAGALRRAGVETPRTRHETVTGAYLDARSVTRAGDRILVCGSFYTVAEVLPRLAAGDGTIA